MQRPSIHPLEPFIQLYALFTGPRDFGLFPGFYTSLNLAIAASWNHAQAEARWPRCVQRADQVAGGSTGLQIRAGMSGRAG
jgi:hypothetical protein